MTFKFTLTDEANTIKVISDPSGWDTASIGFSRDQKWWGLDEIFKSSFLTYGDAREWIVSREKLFGPDGLLSVLVEVDPNDDDQFEFFYSGQIPIGLIIETLGNDGHLLQINFTQADFWTRFKTRIASPVDIRSTVDMDGNAVAATPKFTLPLPSQKIPKSFKASQKNNQFFSINPFGHPPPELILALSFDLVNITEIETYFNFGTATEKELVSPLFNFDSGGTLIINNLKFTFSKEDSKTDANFPGTSIYFTQATADKLSSTIGDLELYIQINNQEPIPFSKSDRNVPATYLDNDGNLITNQETTVTDYTLAGFEKVISKNDALKVYGVIQQDGTDAAKLLGFWLWGNEGWAHESIDESIYFQQGSDTIVTGVSSFFRGVAKNGVPPNEFNQLQWDASINLFPALELDGGGIKAMDTWLISGSGNLGGVLVDDTYVITAIINAPGQIRANWRIEKKHIYEGLEAYGDSEANIYFNSTSPDSTTEAFLTHDVASGIIDRITGQSGLFYSDYFGNQHTSRVYDAVGCGSQLAKMKGLHLRGYPLAGDADPNKNKPYFSSMQDWFEEEYPVHFIGIGYEKKVIDDVEQDVIRCETLDHFFPDGDPVVFLSNVFFIKRSYDPDHQFNSVKIGHQKWQSQAATGVGTPSGIDDAQTVHTYTPRFKKIGKAIEFLSKMVMASLTLETTRRIGNLLSANYTYDNDTFGIAVVRNETDDGYTPELDENFSSITNLSNSDTRYNNRYTPARNFLRGLNYVSGCLQNYLTSLWKFASGEGNYVMTSTMTTDCPGDDSGESVAENGDIPVSSTPLFVPMPYEIDHKLTLEQYKTLRANKYLPIGISQTEADYKKFYIKLCERIVGTGFFKIIAWPKTLDDAFDIVVDESSGQIGSSRRHESRFEPRYD